MNNIDIGKSITPFMECNVELLFFIPLTSYFIGLLNYFCEPLFLRRMSFFNTKHKIFLKTSPIFILKSRQSKALLDLYIKLESRLRNVKPFKIKKKKISFEFKNSIFKK